MILASTSGITIRIQREDPETTESIGSGLYDQIAALLLIRTLIESGRF
jgi:hypothetical protein